MTHVKLTLGHQAIDFNQVKQHSTFLLHHIKSLNDESLNSSILVRELTRMAPPEQTLPPILPPGIYLLPQPGQQPLPGTATVAPPLPAASATASKQTHKIAPLTSQPAPDVIQTPVATGARRSKLPVYASGLVNNTNIAISATPAVNESKFNMISLPVSSYTPKPVYDSFTMPGAAPIFPSIKLKTNTDYAAPTNGHHLNTTPVMQQPEIVVETQTELDTTHDELDFETGFDLEGVFVNDSQEDHHIDGLNTSSYFSLS